MASEAAAAAQEALRFGPNGVLNDMGAPAPAEPVAAAPAAPVMPSPPPRPFCAREMVFMSYKSLKPARKPWVYDKNKGKRVQWALERHSWVEEWSFVFSTDESSFEVRRPTHARFWRVEGERYSPTCLRPSFKSGRQSVMVWGGVSARSRPPLYRVKSSMQSDQYEEVLGDLVYHHGVAKFGSPGGAWLQEDLAPCHASKRSKAVKVDLGLNFLPWTGQIPDLCPIDNAWGELCRRLRERAVAPTNKEDLKQALCEEREAMPADLFTALAESIPRRVEAAIEAKGCGIKC